MLESGILRMSLNTTSSLRPGIESNNCAPLPKSVDSCHILSKMKMEPGTFLVYLNILFLNVSELRRVLKTNEFDESHS